MLNKNPNRIPHRAKGPVVANTDVFKALFRIYVGCLKKYRVFRGRATRHEYWAFRFVDAFAYGVLLLIPLVGVVFIAIYWLVTLPPSLAVAVRRFHDRGKSGWLYAALYTIKFFPLVIVLYAVAGLPWNFIGGISLDNLYASLGKVMMPLSISIMFSVAAMVYSFVVLCGKSKQKENRHGQIPQTDKEQEKIASIIAALVIALEFVMGVIIIPIVVLTIAVLANYYTTMGRHKANRIVDQIHAVSTNIKTLYADKPSYDGLDMKVLYDAGLLDSKICPDGCAGYYGVNEFGGKISIRPINAFVIVYDGIPAHICKSIVSTDWGVQIPGFLGLYVNDRRVDPRGSADDLCSECADYGCRVELQMK